MSIFPNLENVESSVTEEESNIKTVNPTFDYKNKRLVLKDGKVVFSSGKDKVKQWIELLLKTELDKYKVYEGAEFGLADMYNLIGHQLFTSNYGISEMKAELKEKLEAKEEIDSVENITITYKFDKLYIDLTVIVNEEVIESEVIV